jgi:hypothetical protein
MVHADKLRQDEMHKDKDIVAQREQQREQHGHDARERGKERMFNLMTPSPAAPAGSEGKK